MSGEEKGKSMFINTVKSLFGKISKEDNISDIIPETEDAYGSQDKSSFSEEDNYLIDIKIDKKVRAKYKSGWVSKIRNEPITEVVVHGTAGGRSCAGLLNWMYNRTDSKYNEGIGIFHYCIGRGDKGEPDGLIVEVIDPEYFVYHSTSSRHDKSTIGIELLNTSSSNRDPYTDAQYDSLFSLIFDHLMTIYPITRIAGHRYNIWRWNSKATAQKYDKVCPGNFDWARLDEELTTRGYTFKTDGVGLRYDIADSNDSIDS